ncbi:MAG: hypothetical protein M3N47_07535 [Chloroflexota bacterium]|nr:hypothetical protein [Chloroflexota bacterium]
MERRKAEPLTFEMVHHDVACAAIDEVRQGDGTAMKALPDRCRKLATV